MLKLLLAIFVQIIAFGIYFYIDSRQVPSLRESIAIGLVYLSVFVAGRR